MVRPSTIWRTAKYALFAGWIAFFSELTLVMWVYMPNPTTSTSVPLAQRSWEDWCGGASRPW